MIKYITLWIILIFPCFTLFSQTIKELEERKTKTEESLRLTAKLLEQTEKEKEKSINHISILKKQIDLRKTLINDILKQVELLELEISNKSYLVTSYRRDLENLKREYAKLIRFAQKNRSDMEILVFIFASSDFNQAYRRLRFYQQFLRFREKQAREIIYTTTAIEQEMRDISAARNKLAKSKEEKDNELINLSREEKRYAQTVTKLQQNERQLRKELEERKKAMEALDKAITELIAEESRKAAARKDDKVRDARYLELSKGFAGNKGKLPWPTQTGVIVSEFGEHNHPVLKGVKVLNNGIDISTNAGEKVKSIFDGEVTKIVSIPGSNVAVIIRHGDFLTVFSNLVKVQVKIGDTLKAQQIIGETYTDEKLGRGVYNLQIWKESSKLNPAEWILP